MVKSTEGDLVVKCLYYFTFSYRYLLGALPKNPTSNP